MRRFAGLKGPYRLAMGVKESRRRLHRLLYTERCLVHAAAGWFVAARDWETKQALARHLWEDAEHMWSIYERCLQLRGSGAALAKAPDARRRRPAHCAVAAPDTSRRGRASRTGRCGAERGGCERRAAASGRQLVRARAAMAGMLRGPNGRRFAGRSGTGKPVRREIHAPLAPWPRRSLHWRVGA